MATAHIEPNVPAIYGKIAEIQKAVGAIEKNGVGPQQKGGFKFIRAEDVLDKIHALLVEHEVITVPTIVSTKHEVIEANNRMNIYSVVEAEYKYIAVVDGSSVTVTSVGEGSDIGSDTATRKAATQALKISHLHMFTIPGTDLTVFETEGYEPEGKEAAAPTQNKAVANATRTKPAVPAANGNIAKIREDIKAAVDEVLEKTGIKPDYTRIGARLGKGNATWSNDAKILTETLKAIQSGVIE